MSKFSQFSLKAFVEEFKASCDFYGLGYSEREKYTSSEYVSFNLYGFEENKNDEKDYVCFALDVEPDRKVLNMRYYREERETAKTNECRFLTLESHSFDYKLEKHVQKDMQELLDKVTDFVEQLKK
jgi:hypothetical protein